MTYDKHEKTQTCLAVLVSTRDDSVPEAVRAGVVRRAA